MSEITIANGRFKRVPDGDARSIDLGFGKSVDLTGLELLPGYIDVHCHGAAGIDVNAADADGLLEIGRFLAGEGVTGWLPTLVPDSQSAYERTVAAIDEAMARQTALPVAQILGVHYEGVFANELKCGALHREFFRGFTDISQLDSLPIPRSGVKMMTFAPEIEGGVELAKTLSERGWIASIGHTMASPEVLDSAFEAGAKHMTHFFNAMTGIDHRELGVAGWGQVKAGVTFDIIADGIHVDPKMLRFAVDAKKTPNVSLISDSIAPAGLGNGEFEVWGETISVREGRTLNKSGNIAGSVITMHGAVRTMRSLGFSSSDLAAMSSSNPARLLGLENECGGIENGKRADFLLVDDQFEITKVFIGGIEVNKRD